MERQQYEEQDVQVDAEYLPEEEQVEGEEEEEQEEEQQPAPHEYEEEEQEEEQQPAPKPKERLSGQARIQQLTRERFQYEAELRKAREENEKLKRDSEDWRKEAQYFSNFALNQYDNSATLRLEKAKNNKLKAVEDGDVQAQIDADVEIAAATHDLQRLNEWKALDEAKEKQSKALYEQQKKEVQTSRQSPPEVDYQAATDWYQQNSWFNPESPDYDPELAEDVIAYAEKVENYLYRINRPDVITKREYFDEIQHYINSVRQPQRQEATVNNRNHMNMKPSRSGVSPVKHTSSRQGRRENTNLSSEEKDIARLFGITEDAYREQKIKDMRDHPERWVYRR